jgi:hypothetical protein
MLESVIDKLIEMGYDAEELKEFAEENEQFMHDIIFSVRKVELEEVINPS